MNVQTFKDLYLDLLENTTGKKIIDTTDREKYIALAQLSMQLFGESWKKNHERHINADGKEVYYFSMEFLMGRLLTNNLMNFGVYDVAKEALNHLGIDIQILENSEMDAGLGNGGLGRLAACFLDSAASLHLPVHGNTIRYQYGFFDQEIVEGKQQEHVQQWLYESRYEWEVCHPEDKQIIFYGGSYENGMHTPAMKVVAVPYDVPVVGFNGETINTLRMWKAEPDTKASIVGDFTEYEARVRQISSFLYPDDSTEDGLKLRLLQQYFFSSAGAQAIIKKHVDQYGTLDNLAEKVTIQINDTHPTIVIPELMRIFMDEHQYDYDTAWSIVSQTIAYTNHTLLAEALEKWPVSYIKELFPRLFVIIEEINKRYLEYLTAKGISEDKQKQIAIITTTHVQMAYLAVAGSFSVNGVAALHTQLLIEDELKELAQVYPDKFNNKTNGVTHRRWLMYANSELATLISEKIGTDWMTHFDAEIHKLLAFKEDAKFLDTLLDIKQIKKQQLAKFIYAQTGVNISPHSIFDIQIKRLHAYKRQILNALHIIHLYLSIKKGEHFLITPRTYIFGAKAAPAYVLAKEVIYLINVLADVINHDPEVNQKLHVVFLPNYNVTAAEYLFPAADISEQISTAGKEASGTGNMKFMMNGAMTLGTMDGANVEIVEFAGAENNFIFGMNVEEVEALKATNSYNSKEIIDQTPILQEIFDVLKHPTKLGSKLVVNDDAFKNILSDLIDQNDEYFVLADALSYFEAQAKIGEAYRDEATWAKMMLENIAHSGHFTSDRTIAEYNKDIWKIK